MDLNYNEPRGTMADRITALHEKVHGVLSTHCELNRISMGIVHSMGYNGFKRWHRHRAREFFSLKLALMNSLFDKFRITADFKREEVGYSPKTMAAHLKAWDSALLEAIKTLGEANKDYFEETGVRCKIIEKTKKAMRKDYERVGRLLKRFEDSDWITIEMHSVDDELHEKFKRKEKGGGHDC